MAIKDQGSVLVTLRVSSSAEDTKHIMSALQAGANGRARLNMRENSNACDPVGLRLFVSLACLDTCPIGKQLDALLAVIESLAGNELHKVRQAAYDIYCTLDSEGHTASFVFDSTTVSRLCELRIPLLLNVMPPEAQDENDPNFCLEKHGSKRATVRVLVGPAQDRARVASELRRLAATGAGFPDASELAALHDSCECIVIGEYRDQDAVSTMVFDESTALLGQITSLLGARSIPATRCLLVDYMSHNGQGTLHISATALKKLTQHGWGVELRLVPFATGKGVTTGKGVRMNK